MQTIYTVGQQYPFDNQNISGNTFLEVVLQCQSLDQLEKKKQTMNLFKKIQCNQIIKLTKIYRQSYNLHILYQYFDKSVFSFIKDYKASPKYQHIKNITNLKLCISSAIKNLIKNNIKADLLLNMMAVDSEGNIKVFVYPSYTLVNNHKIITDFYETQQKRLLLQIEELYDKYHQNAIKKQVDHNKKGPSFFINGNQLVFVKELDQNTIGKVGSNQQKNNNEQRDRKGSQVKVNIPEKKQIKLQSQIFDTSGSGKVDSLIKKSKQLQNKINSNMSRQAKFSNDKNSSFNDNSEGSSKKSIEYLSKMTDSLQQNKNESFSKPNKSYDSNHNNNKNQQVDNEKSNNITSNNTHNSNGAIQENKKIKIKFTTYHQIQVQAKDYEKIQQQMQLNQNNGKDINQLLKGIKFTQKIQKQKLIPTEITNQLAQENVAKSLNVQQHHKSSINRAKQLQERAKQLFKVKGDKNDNNK